MSTSEDNPSPEERLPTQVDDIAAIAVSEFEKLPEDHPPIEITFFYGAHTTEADLGNYPSLLDANDYVILEVFGWTQTGLQQRLDVINATRPFRADQIPWAESIIEQIREKNPHQGALLDALYATHKTFLVVDVHSGDQLVERQDSLDLKSKDTIAPIKEVSFDEALTSLDDMITEHAEIQSKREKYMVEQLAPAIEKHAKGQKPIRILWKLGAAHTAIYQGLRKASEVTSTRVFADDPPVFEYYVEAIRNRIFGTEVDKELLARVWLERALSIKDGTSGKGVNEPGELSNSWSRYHRGIIDLFSMEEIESLYDHMQSADSLEGMAKILDDSIRSKGIEYPPKSFSDIVEQLKKTSNS